MGISLGSVRAAAKQIAQNSPTTGSTGIQLLLTDPADYTLAVKQALARRDVHSPNTRVVDVLLAADGFRFVLSGAGVLAGLTDADAWSRRHSSLQEVRWPYDGTVQGLEPMDPNSYRIVRDPGGAVVLEFTEDRGTTGETLRLQFTRPHVLTEAPNDVLDPAAAPSAALASTPAAGNVEDGTHSYVFTWLTAHGETLPSPATAPVTVADKSSNGQVEVVIPVSDDYGVTGAKVYRTVAGDTGTRKLVGTLTADGGGGTFTDNVADGSLGADVPSANTAGGTNTLDDDEEDVFVLLAGAMVLQMAAIKAVQNTGNTGLVNDVVDRRTQSDQYRSRAKELMMAYYDAEGLGDKAVQPASAVAEMDTDFSDQGPMLWHPKAFR